MLRYREEVPDKVLRNRHGYRSCTFFGTIDSNLQRNKASKNNKSITARQILKQCPQVRLQLWGGEFWTDGYFTGAVGKHGDENMISKYVKNQGKEYAKLYADHQLSLF